MLSNIPLCNEHYRAALRKQVKHRVTAVTFTVSCIDAIEVTSCTNDLSQLTPVHMEKLKKKYAFVPLPPPMLAQTLPSPPTTVRPMKPSKHTHIPQDGVD